jgi:hypothetical protein
LHHGLLPSLSHERNAVWIGSEITEVTARRSETKQFRGPAITEAGAGGANNPD